MAAALFDIKYRISFQSSIKTQYVGRRNDRFLGLIINRRKMKLAQAKRMRYSFQP